MLPEGSKWLILLSQCLYPLPAPYRCYSQMLCSMFKHTNRVFKAACHIQLKMITGQVSSKIYSTVTWMINIIIIIVIIDRFSETRLLTSGTSTMEGMFWNCGLSSLASMIKTETFSTTWQDNQRIRKISSLALTLLNHKNVLY